MSDDGLLARAMGGDSDALERLCRETWLDLYAYVYWRVQNREEAQDITQETYARLLASAPRVEVRNGDVTGLLRTIALNLARDGWRRRKVRRERLVPLTPADPVVEAMGRSGDDEASRAEFRLMVRAALDRLPAEQGQVINLRLLQGYPVRETARLMGKTEAAVRSLQYRGLKTLAAFLSSEGGVGDA